MKIIFFGTPQIAVLSLEYLIKTSDIEVIAVITQPDKPCGRGKCVSSSPIKLVALENNIPVYQPTSIRKDAELIKTLKELEPDFFITFAFGQILSQEVLDLPKFGTINLHASLLPKYRGANPVQAPIINGDNFTGITTMLTEIGVDTGPIVLQKVIEITENMDAVELTEIISRLSPDLIYESIVGLYNEKIKTVSQKDEEATHAPKVIKDDGIINWSESAVQIHNKVRGLKPWPSCFTYINKTCIKVTETRLCEEKITEGNFGEIVGKTGNGINVITGAGIVTITKVQPACKKEMAALSWYNGARIEKGACFRSFCESEAECAYEISCEIFEK